MNAQESESQLIEAMKRLETATDKILKTNGYTTDVKKMRLLAELIKEQIKNENSLRATSPVR
jgi:hypothetical protein